MLKGPLSTSPGADGPVEGGKFPAAGWTELTGPRGGRVGVGVAVGNAVCTGGKTGVDIPRIGAGCEGVVGRDTALLLLSAV